MYPNAEEEARPSAINFEESHKKFVLTIKPIIRSQIDRDYCRASLSHWVPILSEKGVYDPHDHPPLDTGGDINKFYDYRGNLGPHCFASYEATVKFFDRDIADRFVGYGIGTASHEFVGLPGEWLKLYHGNFEAGEPLDAGPVVFTGKCERVD